MNISFLIILFLLLIIGIIGFRLYKLLILVLELESGIENCFLILENSHKELVKISEKDVFFDSIEVRSAINEINKSHQAIVSVAKILTENFTGQNEIKKIKQEKENEN